MSTVIQVKITTVKRNEEGIFVTMLTDGWIHIWFSVTPKQTSRESSKANAFLCTYIQHGLR